jgi:methionine sulfoxide reductase catalytic subunit
VNIYQRTAHEKRIVETTRCREKVAGDLREFIAGTGCEESRDRSARAGYDSGMFNILSPQSWSKVNQATPERLYVNRRSVLAAMGLGTIGVAASGLVGCSSAIADKASMEKLRENFGPVRPPQSRFDHAAAKRNEAYTIKEPLTDATTAATYNNFYEFGLEKTDPALKSHRFVTTPWSITVDGLVKERKTYDLEELLKSMTIEERLYRFRCVEAWSMRVPWSGFRLGELIKKVEPLGDAKFVKFYTANVPEQMPGIKEASYYPWPYYEGLRIDEAMNDLTLLALGIYGKPMPNQHGAPLRLVVPWKYGYKSIKSIVRIEFTAEQPKTFWSELQPTEYPFESNVDPKVPHPRWSQATERLIDTGERIDTLPFNGYGEQVAGIYQ